MQSVLVETDPFKGEELINLISSVIFHYCKHLLLTKQNFDRNPNISSFLNTYSTLMELITGAEENENNMHGNNEELELKGVNNNTLKENHSFSLRR